jgi:hypothetical protein
MLESVSWFIMTILTLVSEKFVFTGFELVLARAAVNDINTTT